MLPNFIKKILVISFVLVGFFLLVTKVFGAWNFEEDFNDLNNGILTGQGTWQVEPTFESWYVQSDVTYEGEKGITTSASTTQAVSWHIIPDTTQGTLYYAFRFDSEITSGELFLVRLYDYYTATTTLTAFNTYISGSNLLLANRTITDYKVAYTSLTINTWYKAQIEYDCVTDKVRMRIYDGTWNNWTDYLDFGDPTDKLNRISLIAQGDPVTNFYVDWISASENPPAPPITHFIIPVEANWIATSSLAYVGRLYTDSTQFIVLILGLIVGFYVINKVISLVTKRIKS